MTGKEVAILRIGHRPERDQRVTTHVALTGRALGASGMFLAASDKGVVESVNDVADRWGGKFFCEDNVQWRACIREWKAAGGKVVHLTMYGINLPDIIGEIRPCEKLLIVVGAEKVPGRDVRPCGLQCCRDRPAPFRDLKPRAVSRSSLRGNGILSPVP